jgi:hypothetical protein
MEEMSKHGNRGMAAMKAGMDRKTGKKYIREAKLPSEMKGPRDWRTREDPFAEGWAEIEELLRGTPELEAKTVFEHLCEKYPGRHEPGQVRTLQRRIRHWRAEDGPEKEIVFGQAHRAGEAAQTDFTNALELGVTIAGQVFAHLLCVFVLPYSNWQWATVCLSESMAALRNGVQRALFQVGRVPRHHQTDNSTEVGAKEQNGDVESANGALKRRLDQALLLRGNRDFESVEAWQAFVDEVVRKANKARGQRVTEDIEAMRELNVAKLPEFTEELARVSERTTIRVSRCTYSVPSRLIGEVLHVRVYEDRIEAYYGDAIQLSCERLRGRNQKRIDYRHVIWSLVRKPGAFERYVHRDEMFPSLIFRQAYDVIQTPHRGTKGDVEYLRILHLAASTMEAQVEAALIRLLADGHPVTADAVKTLVLGEARPSIPEMPAPHVDLGTYDSLLTEVSQ